MSGLDPNGGGALVVPGGGGLPTATAAGQALLSSGAGADYTAGDLGLGGLIADRPAADVAYVGRSYYATDVGVNGALYICVTDGAGMYGWTNVPPPLEDLLDGQVAGTAAVASGAGGTIFTEEVIAVFNLATTEAEARAALGIVDDTTGAVSTTDATVTTLASVPTAANRCHTLTVTISAMKHDRSAMVSWIWLVTATNNSGTVTIRDALQVAMSDPAPTIVDGTSPVAFDVSGTSVRVRVKGVAATTVDWSATVTTLLGGT